MVNDLSAMAQPPIDLVLSYSQPVVISDLAIVCSSPDQTAIRIVYPDAPSVAVLTVTIRNVTILPGCKRGIHLTNAWNAHLQQVTLWGSPAAPMDNGVVLDGRSNDVVMDGLHTFYTQRAIYVTGQSESPHITNSAFITTADGIVIDTEHVVPERPGLFISGNHVSSTRRGIVTAWHPQGFITSNLLYRVGSDPTYVGIEVGFRSADTILVGNTVVCQAPAAGTRAVTVSTGAPRTIGAIETNSLYCAAKTQSVTTTAILR